MSPRYLSVIQRVADALNAVPGAVQITGHTDNVPIRGIRRFPSNFELSQARAEVVRDMIDRDLPTSGARERRARISQNPWRKQRNTRGQGCQPPRRSGVAGTTSGA